MHHSRNIAPVIENIPVLTIRKTRVLRKDNAFDIYIIFRHKLATASKGLVCGDSRGQEGNPRVNYFYRQLSLLQPGLPCRPGAVSHATLSCLSGKERCDLQPSREYSYFNLRTTEGENG